MNFRNEQILSLLAVLMMLVSAQPAAAAGKGVTPPPPPGSGGDSVLPAGYRGVAWGASAEALMAIRGGMELQVTPDPRIKKLIELPPPGADSEAIVRHWTLWNDKLVEVTMFFPGEFTVREGRELKERFETQYGPGRLEKTRKSVESGTSVWDVKVEQQIVEQRWVWQDPFTIQELRNDVRKGQWVCVRQSRMFEVSRQAQDQADRKKAHSKRVKSIVLD
jgi:hypothetical protein